MQTQTIRIGGMTCVSCRDRIEKTLKSTAGVGDAAVNFNSGTATVSYNASVVAFHEIKAAIEKLGYTVLAEKEKPPVLRIIGTAVIILALYALLRGLGIGTLTSAFPLAEAGMGYGMLFVIGLVTSVHCAAMCGGINLSQCIPVVATTETGRRREVLFPAILFPSILYNAGRVISYTVVGALAGALGQAVTVSGRFQGIVQLLAGVFMVIMGINMLGLLPGSAGTMLRRFHVRMPKIFARKIDEQKTGNRNPLFIGLLNGFMPCGPLQAMQLYALSTGSPVAGGISLFLFSMGTVPLMFGIGALSSALSKKFTHRVMKVGAILVTVMGMTMFTYGFGLSGFNFDVIDRVNPFSSTRAAFQYGNGEAGTGAFQPVIPVIENGVQMVNSALSGGRYPAITVQQGIPVKWTINAPAGSINGCNNRMIIREYKIEHRFTPGENVIEFTPDKAGRFSYSCWMGMIRSSITVVEEGQSAADVGEPDLNPAPAGVLIPTDSIVLAEMQGETYGVPYQAVTVRLRDDGIDPAVIVLQRDVPALWTITNDSLDPGNSALIVPAYYSRLDIEQGDNVIQLMPVDDFDFSTADNVFYGYVKVVDDLSSVDPASMEAIKAEVAGFETQIYPDAYFEASSGGGCCGGAGG
jgi:sulfite exporter TauE/SafE/copper chaperone CopZ